MRERDIYRPCDDCGRRTRFTIQGHVPSGIPLLCPSCIRQRAEDVARDRTPKQRLRKATDKRARNTTP